jgi:hypothetical protein
LFLLHRPRLLLVLYPLRDGSSLAGLMVSLLGATSLFSFGLMQLPGNLHLKSILRRDMFRCTPVYVSKTALRSIIQNATEGLINIISLMLPIFLPRKSIILIRSCEIVCVSVFLSIPLPFMIFMFLFLMDLDWIRHWSYPVEFSVKGYWNVVNSTFGVFKSKLILNITFCVV